METAYVARLGLNIPTYQHTRLFLVVEIHVQRPIEMPYLTLLVAR